jgi:hypothetical protein
MPCCGRPHITYHLGKARLAACLVLGGGRYAYWFPPPAPLHYRPFVGIGGLSALRLDGRGWMQIAIAVGWRVRSHGLVWLA